MKNILLHICMLVSLGVYAQGPYASQAGAVGSSAMHKDSSAFIGWAGKAKINRGKRDISKPNSDTTSVGNTASCFGIADGNVVSLGDSGHVTLQFNGNIYNGPGHDFAVFENAFNNTFLELAFVEVSSDGVNFFRFPSHSLTDTSQPVGSFGVVDPTNVHNLAGKYRANYGTPFDLEELNGTPGLDVQNISHIRVIDVIGSLDSTFASRDSKGRKINDQYPTEFPSGGFDLDAVGVVYLKTVGIKEHLTSSFYAYPNPSFGQLYIDESWVGSDYYLMDVQGKQVTFNNKVNSGVLLFPDHLKGVYFLVLENEKQAVRTKIVIQ